METRVSLRYFVNYCRRNNSLHRKNVATGYCFQKKYLLGKKTFPEEKYSTVKVLNIKGNELTKC